MSTKELLGVMDVFYLNNIYIYMFYIRYVCICTLHCPIQWPIMSHVAIKILKCDEPRNCFSF